MVTSTLNCEAQSYSPMNVLWLKLSTEHSTHTPQMFHEHPAMFSSITSESAALYSYMPHTMCTCCCILTPTTVHTLCITTHLLLMKRQQIHRKRFNVSRSSNSNSPYNLYRSSDLGEPHLSGSLCCDEAQILSKSQTHTAIIAYQQ